MKTIRLQTVEGAVHAGGFQTQSSRQRNGEVIKVQVLVLKCGIAATGNRTTDPVNCPNCLKEAMV